MNIISSFHMFPLLLRSYLHSLISITHYGGIKSLSEIKVERVNNDVSSHKQLLEVKRGKRDQAQWGFLTRASYLTVQNTAGQSPLRG